MNFAEFPPFHFLPFGWLSCCCAEVWWRWRGGGLWNVLWHALVLTSSRRSFERCWNTGGIPSSVVGGAGLLQCSCGERQTHWIFFSLLSFIWILNWWATEIFLDLYLDQKESYCELPECVSKKFSKTWWADPFWTLNRVTFGADTRKNVQKPGVLTSIVMLFCIRKVFPGGFSFLGWRRERRAGWLPRAGSSVAFPMDSTQRFTSPLVCVHTNGLYSSLCVSRSLEY